MRIRLLLPLTASAGILLLAGCGSSSSAASAGTTVAPVAGTTVTSIASGTAPASTVSSAAGAAGVQAYRDCLASHGVTLPSRPASSSTAPGGSAATGDTAAGATGGGGGRGGLGSVTQSTDPAVQSAVAACQSLQPQPGTGGARNNPANAQAFQAYRACLSDNGVTVPTTVAGQAPQGGALGGIDRSSPAFQAANAKCQVLLPTPAAATTTSAP